MTTTTSTTRHQIAGSNTIAASRKSLRATTGSAGFRGLALDRNGPGIACRLPTS
jgi:hypothetical protein